MNIKMNWCMLSFFFMLTLRAEVSALTLPETLNYDLTIADIKIGSLSLEATDKGSYIQLMSKGSAAGWVSLFYNVDDNAVSLLAKRQMKELPESFAFLPYSAKVSINEGKNSARKEFAFDYAKKVVTYSDLLNHETGNFVLKDITFDALSGLYYIRHIPMKPGSSVYVKIFNNKLVYKVQVQVLRRETLNTSFGAINTFVIRANMDCVGDGIIYYPGDITLWLTDDERKIPVMIEKRLQALIEGKLPAFIKNNMPDFLQKKLSAGAIRMVLVKK